MSHCGTDGIDHLARDLRLAPGCLFACHGGIDTKAGEGKGEDPVTPEQELRAPSSLI